MMILAIEREVPGVTEEEFRPHLKEEAARVWELYQAGVFRKLYFRQDQPSAVLVLECADIEEAKDLFVVDGFLHDIPLPDGFADVLITSQAIGWRLEDELEEIERVVKKGGFIIHRPGATEDTIEISGDEDREKLGRACFMKTRKS